MRKYTMLVTRAGACALPLDVVQKMGIYGKPAEVTVTVLDNGKVMLEREMNIYAREEMAQRVLSCREARISGCHFHYEDMTTVCILNYRGRTYVGTSTCAPNDYYSREIGKAIAFERAYHGKVITTPLIDF